MNYKVRRIHILGGPGSGKTYAAKRLSKLLNITHFDLDELNWDKKDNSYRVKTPESTRDRELSNILKKEKWIIEGVYYQWVHNSFLKADLIIILRSNVYLRDWRIIKRFILRKLGIIKSKKERVRDFFSFLKWNHQFDSDWLVKAEFKIKPFKDKIKYFDKADDAITYFLRMNKN